MDNSENPLLLFGTHVVEWSDTVKVLFSDAQKKFFEFLSIVQLPIAFFGSRLVPLINYAIGPSTLKVQESYSSWKITPIRYSMLRSCVLFCRCVRECLFLTMLQFLETLIFFITWLPNTKLTQDVQTRYNTSHSLNQCHHCLSSYEWIVLRMDCRQFIMLSSMVMLNYWFHSSITLELTHMKKQLYVQIIIIHIMIILAKAYTTEFVPWSHLVQRCRHRIRIPCTPWYTHRHGNCEW